MTRRNWSDRLFGSHASRKNNKRRSHRRQPPFGRQARLEGLETRRLLTAFDVYSTADSGPGSLRQAIIDSNATAGPNAIVFDLTAGDAIQPLSPLPAITTPVTIDGTTAQGWSGSPGIQIDGSQAGAGANGFDLAAPGSTIEGLTIGNFSGNGIQIEASASGATIEGDYIGTDISGTLAMPNYDGILINGAASTLIGGSTDWSALTNPPNGSTGVFSGQGNIISGNRSNGIESLNATGTLIAGNLIGLDASGDNALPNGGDGIDMNNGTNNMVGGTTPDARNVIAGNVADGGAGAVQPWGESNDQIEGNYIDTNAAGTALVTIANTILIGGDSTDITVGGLTASPGTGAGNVISGGDIHIYADGSGNTIEGNLIGTDYTGATSLANYGAGIVIDGDDNTIGGTTPGARNIISGHAGVSGVLIQGNSNTVEGNYIGTDVTGTAALANGTGIQISGGSDNVIGGTTGAARNTISGNSQDGVLIGYPYVGSGNIVEGNYIGTDATGTAALGNGAGVIVADSNNIIGGLTPIPGTGAGNVISGNGVGIGFNFGVGSPADTNDNSVEGNIIGLNAAGTATLPTSFGSAGVYVGGGSGDTIGGASTGARNVISGSDGVGVVITDGATSTTVAGNYVGTDITGTVALGDNYAGVAIMGASGNIIGGTTAAGRNVISGNEDGVYIGDRNTASESVVNSIGAFSSVQPSSGNIIEGNYIGTDVSGTAALGNTYLGVEITSGDNTIGVPGAGNVISGTTQGQPIGPEGAGVALNGPSATGDVVQANYIGTNAAGTAALPNVLGVLVEHGASSNTIGGTASGAGNVISGNSGYGIQVDGAASAADALVDNYVGTGTGGSGSIANTLGSLAITNGASTSAAGTFNGDVLDDGTLDLAGNDVSIVGGLNGSGTVRNTGSGTSTLSIDGTGSFSGIIQDDGPVTLTIGGGTETLSGANTYSGGTAIEAGTLVVTGTVGSGPVTIASGATLDDEVISSADSGLGTLRQAISNADLASGAGSNEITFAIPGSGAQTIQPLSPLPAITTPVTIDGTTAQDWAGSPVIQIDGSQAGAGANGFDLAAPGSTIEGLAIGNFSGNGIQVEASAAGATIEGDYIGTDLSGTVALANLNGILVNGASNTVIGGLTGMPGFGAGNIISGNSNENVFVLDATGTLIEGNLIGLDATGNNALHVDGGDGVLLQGGSDNTVGGTTAAVRNVISGNYVDYPTGSPNAGVEVSDESGDVIEGNYIGTNAAGNAAVANAYAVNVDNGSTDTTIGGLTASPGTGAGNLISGSEILIASSQNTIAGNLIGTDATGKVALANYGAGIVLGDDNTVGGTTPGARNIISGHAGVSGVLIQGNSNTVEGNYIGTDVTGTAALANGTGIQISGGSDNVIGGTTGAARNIISGNSQYGVQIGYPYAGSGNVVEGNYIGTDVTGTVELGDGSAGVDVGAPNNIIGGLTSTPGSGAGNVISGDGFAVHLEGTNASDCSVEGNILGGLNAAGTMVLANDGVGVLIDHGSEDTIGGDTPGARNIISTGNAGAGVVIGGGLVGATNNVVAGNYIGTDVTGTVGLGDGYVGVLISGASDNTIGGATVAARNIISDSGDGVFIGGNLDYPVDNLGGFASTLPSTGNLVEGNYVGTDVSGAVALGNGYVGVEVTSADNTIGAPGSGNVISATESGAGAGQHGMGVFLNGPLATGNVVQANYIGTDASGTTALPNESSGVVVGNGASNNTIGGTASGAGNVISGNGVSGVFIDEGSAQNALEGNFIGTDVTGTRALPNATAAAGTNGNTWGGVVLFGPNNTIGGAVAGARNVISGNDGDGVEIGGNTGYTGNFAAPPDNVVEGNYIGTDVTGTSQLANSANGVEIDGASGNTVGTIAAGGGNVIAYNGAAGVVVVNEPASQAVDDSIRGNSIFANSALGISLNPSGNESSPTPNHPNGSGVGANNLENYPVLAAAASTTAGGTFVLGTLNSTPNTAINIDVYADDAADPSGYGQGKYYLGTFTVTTDANGNASFMQVVPGATTGGQFVSATATDSAGNTSEFAADTTVLTAGAVESDQVAGAGFWRNKNGQALIDSFNGGPNATALANWLAGTFPNIYGVSAGNDNLTGTTNSMVAAFDLALFAQHGLDAQVLATALNVYATTLSLGGTAAEQYGFSVTADGLGASSYNVGSSGAAFDVADNTELTVIQILQAANQQAVSGVLYAGNGTLRSLANTVFSGIN